MFFYLHQRVGTFIPEFHIWQYFWPYFAICSSQVSPLGLLFPKSEPTRTISNTPRSDDLLLQPKGTAKLMQQTHINEDNSSQGLYKVLTMRHCNRTVKCISQSVILQSLKLYEARIFKCHLSEECITVEEQVI